MSETELLEYLKQFAFDPLRAYGIIVFFIFACSVILPFPEELLVLGAGLVAHAGEVARVEGRGGAVSPVTMAIVCYFAVLLSDLLVYFLGRFAGGRIIQTRFFQLRFAGEKYDRINRWFERYGGWAAGLFRFTPGLRFPGHLCCGFLGLSLTKFVSADAVACLLFIPPQILLLAYFGEEVIRLFTRAQTFIPLILLSGALFFVLLRYFRRKSDT